MAWPDYLQDAIDTHVHSAPDIDPRRYDDFDLAREAARAGMAAIVIKSHQNSTAERAMLVSRVVPEIRVFGGLVLNRTVGGFNPAAVELALRMGARQIWMPTRSARNHRLHHGEHGGLTVLDESGSILSEVLKILDLCAHWNCMLGTGHLSPEESCVLIDEARRRGVKRIVVTHPEWACTNYPLDLQKRLAALGGVKFERCFVSTTHLCGYTPIKTIADAIAHVGVDTTILATDLGQPSTPPPAEGFRAYAELLRSEGFSASDLHRMMAENAAEHLDIKAVSSAEYPA